MSLHQNIFSTPLSVFKHSQSTFAKKSSFAIPHLPTESFCGVGHGLESTRIRPLVVAVA